MAFVSPGCPREEGDVDPREPVHQRRSESPPPSQEDVTSKAVGPRAARGDPTPDFEFSKDFASLDEFLAFADRKSVV